MFYLNMVSNVSFILLNHLLILRTTSHTTLTHVLGMRTQRPRATVPSLLKPLHLAALLVLLLLPSSLLLEVLTRKVLLYLNVHQDFHGRLNIIDQVNRTRVKQILSFLL